MIAAHNARHQTSDEEAERRHLRAEMLAERERLGLNTSSKYWGGNSQLSEALEQAHPDDDDDDDDNDNDISDSETLHTSSDNADEFDTEEKLEHQILEGNMKAADLKVRASEDKLGAKRQKIKAGDKRLEAAKLEVEAREMDIAAAGLEMEGRKRKHSARCFQASAKKAKLELWYLRRYMRDFIDDDDENSSIHLKTNDQFIQIGVPKGVSKSEPSQTPSPHNSLHNKWNNIHPKAPNRLHPSPQSNQNPPLNLPIKSHSNHNPNLNKTTNQKPKRTINPPMRKSPHKTPCRQTTQKRNPPIPPPILSFE